MSSDWLTFTYGPCGPPVSLAVANCLIASLCICCILSASVVSILYLSVSLIGLLLFTYDPFGSSDWLTGVSIGTTTKLLIPDRSPITAGNRTRLFLHVTNGLNH